MDGVRRLGGARAPRDVQRRQQRRVQALHARARAREVHEHEALVGLGVAVLRARGDAEVLDLDREHHLGQLVGRQRVAVQRAQRTDRRSHDRARAAEADLARDGRRPAHGARAAPEASDGRVDEGARRVAERIGRGRRLGVRGEPRHADRQHRPAVAVGRVARQRGASGRATQGHRAGWRPGRAGAARARRRSVRTRGTPRSSPGWCRRRGAPPRAPGARRRRRPAR